jgi:putative spermidine/putrescine transport system ATP-binding protein
VSAGPIVQLQGVRKSYGRTQAVASLDLDIARGSFASLLGPSGSGKTTILRLIAGFEFPDSGRILLNGTDVSALKPNQRDVNTVFQDYALFPHMTLLDNVAYGMRARRLPAQEARSRAETALAQVRLADLASRKPAQLSGGQRQRVALARAIVNRPSLLLLDEPLGALDLKLRHQMQGELKALQAETGITFLYVTHDQEEALSMSDRVAVFNRGRIEQQGTPADIYERPASAFVADFVGSSTLLLRGGRTIMLRPEKVRLSPAACALPPGEISEAGVIRQVQYLGMATRITVELADGTRLLASGPPGQAAFSSSLGSGQMVTASWRREDAYVLQA